MFLWYNESSREELEIHLEDEFFDTGLSLRNATNVPPLIQSEDFESGNNAALHIGLYHYIVDTDRLGFLFGMYYFEYNVDLVFRMLIRHGILNYADLVLQRLAIRSRRQQSRLPYPIQNAGFHELCELSRLLWGVFFDALDRDFRRY